MQHLFDELKKIRTPIIYDAIERFGVRPRSEGYTNGSIRSILPSLESLIGYACTAKVIAEFPPLPHEHIFRMKDVWEYVRCSSSPSVIVIQDLDQPPGKGCAMGDLAASIFLNLGCKGVVTNGGVRDIREVEKLGFQLYASNPVVGHAYIRYVEIDVPVKIGSLLIHPGDLIHADEHGVVIIPKEVPLPALLDVAHKFLKSEAVIVDYCQQPGFDLEELVHLVDQHEDRMSHLEKNLLYKESSNDRDGTRSHD